VHKVLRTKLYLLAILVWCVSLDAASGPGRSRTYWPEEFADAGAGLISADQLEVESEAELGEYQVPRTPSAVQTDLVARTMAHQLHEYAINSGVDLKSHVVTILHRGRTHSAYTRWLVPHLKRLGFRVCVIRYRPRTNDEIESIDADNYRRYSEQLDETDEEDTATREHLEHKLELIEQRRERMRRKLQRVLFEKSESELLIRLRHRVDADPTLQEVLSRTAGDLEATNYVYRNQTHAGELQALYKTLSTIKVMIEALEKRLAEITNDDATLENLLEKLNELDRNRIKTEAQILSLEAPADRAIKSFWRRVTTSMRILFGLQEGLSIAFYKDEITGVKRPASEKKRDFATGVAMAFIVGVATAINIPFDDPSVNATAAIAVNAFLEVYGNYYGFAKSACFAQGLQYFADARKRIGINRPFFYFASWAHSVLTSSLYMVAKVGVAAALEPSSMLGIFRNSLVGVFAKGPVKLWLAKHQRTGNSAHATDSKGHSLNQTRLYNFAGDAFLQILKAADINSDSVLNAQSLLYLGLGIGGAVLALRERAYGDTKPETWTEAYGLWKKRFLKDVQAVKVFFRHEKPKHRCTEILIRPMTDSEMANPLRAYIF